MSTVFFQVEMHETTLNQESYFMFMINDVSTFIRYQRLIGEKKLLEQINAIVSHEMRNPLNSILAMINKIIYHKDVILHNIEDPEIRDFLRDLLVENMDEITACTMTLRASTKLLEFEVSDMLTLAQIESNKFRINIVSFDIREAVLEVMEIQKEKASFNRITFTSEYEGFHNGFIIESDEMRVKQILLNLQSNALKFTKRGGSVSIRVTYLSSRPLLISRS